MIDLSKLGGQSGGGALPTPGVSAAPAVSALPDFAAPKAAPDPNEAGGHNMIWDQLGRAVFGDQNADPMGKHGGLLGDIPVVSDVARAPGVAWRGLLDAGGVGVGAVMGGLAEAAGRAPSASHVTDNYGLGDPSRIGQSTVSASDPKYVADTRDPVSIGRAGAALATDLQKAHGGGDMATQFLLLGQWQKQYDPEAFADWQKTLAKAQSGDGIGSHAGEDLSKYIRDWSVAYMDTTPDGVEGWLGVAPELAFAGEGSFGQGFTDDLARIFTPQKAAEKGAAQLSGSQGGGIGPIPVGPHLYYGDTDYGSRINELLQVSDTDPKKLTPVEAAVIAGIKTEGWTMNHAYNFLVSHGQGYSHNAGVQTVLGMALDPTFVAGSGAGLAASVGERAALGVAKSATGASRLTAAYRGMAEAIGTTVQAVRADPLLGPAAKVARAVVDPFSAFPAGTREGAKMDVYAAAGLKATEQGLGHAAVSDMFRRAEGWGVRDMADRAFGVSAMNFMRKFSIASHIDNLTKFTEPGARRAVTEDLIQEIGQNAPKDAVSRGADYVMKKREFWLSDAGQAQLSERIATAVGKPLAEVQDALKTMSRDEQAVWHVMSYSEAWTDWVTAARSVAPEEWGSLAKRVDDMVILNPHELDNVAAQNLHAAVSKLKGAPAVKAWNEAASTYSLIENLGRITTGGPAQLERRLNALDRIIQEGGLHTALDEGEMAALPASVKRDFMGKWAGADGQPLWRVGFKPNALQATGLVYDAAGKLAAKYEPAIENVTTAIPRATGGIRSVLDPLGRVIPDGVTNNAAAKAAGRLTDSLEVAMNVARDKVSSERVMTSMEQSFRKQMRSAGYGDKVAKSVFKQSRTYAQDHGFTLAGMSPDEFWKANQETLKDVVDARVAKRDMFTMLARSAGGDMRLLGLSSGMTQRLRSGLIARGLDPNNYVGAITVKAYNALRYALNPTFFLQAEFDAPWFNMYRGVMFDLRGRAPKAGSAMYEMQGITEAMSHSSLARDLQMDYTERIATIGWQREVVDQLKAIPGFEQGVGQRVKNRLGRMVLNNELAFLNSKSGEIVLDAIDTTKASLAKKAAEAATPEEAAIWTNQGMDIERVFAHLTEEMQGTLGRLPSKDELGRRYMSEMIDDSRLEVRTREGLLDYQQVAQKGAYHVPTSIGEVRPLNMDYGAESLALPNIHDVATLKTAMKEGVYTTADVRDIMKNLGYHADHIQRFLNGATFNWRYYFDDLRNSLGMSKFEMQGIEDLVAGQAKAVGMEPVDYITQVLPMTAKRAKPASAAAAEEAARAKVAFTPREPVAAPAGIFEHTTANGGGTFDVATGQEMGLKRGYGVANGGAGGQVVDNTQEAVHAAYSEVSKTGAPNIGTWFNPEDGKVYVDPTQVVTNKAEAMRLARARGEKAIFDFKTMSDINIEQIVDPTLGLSDHMKATLDIMRAAGNPDMTQMTKVVASHLHPSMKEALLDHFMERITGKNGLIETAMAAGDTKTAQDLNLVLEDLKGGWGGAADTEFRSLVQRRAGGEVASTGEQLPQPWKDPKINPYAANTELVRVNDILPFREIDREVTPKFRGDFAHLDELTADIKANGFKDPIILDYDPQHGLGLLGEGNHRLAVAQRLGLDNVPMRVVRTDLSGEARAVKMAGHGAAEAPAEWTIRDGRYSFKTKAEAQAAADRGKAATQPERLGPLLDARPVKKDGRWYVEEQRGAPGATRALRPLPKGLTSTFEVKPNELFGGAEGAPMIHGVVVRDAAGEMRGELYAYPDSVTGELAVQHVFVDPKFRRQGIANNMYAELEQQAGVTLKPSKQVLEDGQALWNQPGRPFGQAKRQVVEGLNPRIKPNEHGYFPGDTAPSSVGFSAASRDIAEPEVERAARYFSQYVQTLDPKMVAGDVMRNIVDNIPVEGASPYHFTQGVLMNTLAENFRLAEKDAIRLAHMSTDRSVLERSINHPFFAMYPSSYFWGKVIPETFRFIGYEPFGMKTSLGAQAYYHTKQSIDLQSQYDPRMKALWASLGKSAVVGLLSYLSPSMPWEDMKSNLPPWLRSLSKGDDFSAMLQKEIDTFSPDRWVKHFTDAGAEVGAGVSSVVDSMNPKAQQGLQQISAEGASGATPPVAGAGFSGPTKGLALGPVLQGDLADLQAALSK